MTLSDQVKEIMAKMPAVFVPEKATNLYAIIQLELTDEGAGSWILNFSNGTFKVVEGQAEAPHLTLTMPASDYVAISKGESNPLNLFMAGRVKAQGDLGLAMKFPQMFNRSSA